MSKLMPDVAAYLAGRRDVQVLATGEGTAGDRIIAVQLRRVWEKFTYAASVFSPHEKERWHYYGQAVIIEEAKFDRAGELSQPQEDLRAAMTKVGAETVLAKTLDFVKGVLGPEPGNWDEYERRVEK